MILVINLGLKSIRAILFDRNGNRLTSSSRRINSRLLDGKVEQDAKEWREKLFQVVREVADAVTTRVKVDYITVSCSASCLVAVDEALEPLGHVIMVSDKRAREQGKRIAAHPAFKKLASSYGYAASEYSQISRMLWLKENDPETYNKTWKFLSPNDYLIALLSGGQAVTDQLNAEKLFFDTRRNTYPNDLYDAFELSTEKLPQQVAIGQNIGQMSAHMAEDLGIPAGAEIVVGTYDAICSVFGTGVCSPGQVCDVSGTVTSVRMYSDKPFIDGKSRVMCQHFPPSNGYLVGGSNNLGGGLIEWTKQCFYKEIQHPYELMQTESENSTGANRAGIVFLPHLLGARAPSWNGDARGVFFGLERHHDRGDLMRAVFESLAFSIRDFLEIFRESGTKPDMITASGGLAKIQIANEIKATITGLPYHFMDEFESTSLGAAIIVMCATNQFPSYQEACRQIVATKQIFLPRQQDRAYYDDMYGLYCDLMKASEPAFVKRRNIMQTHMSNVAEYVENL